MGRGRGEGLWGAEIEGHSFFFMHIRQASGYHEFDVFRNCSAPKGLVTQSYY